MSDLLNMTTLASTDIDSVLAGIGTASCLLFILYGLKVLVWQPFIWEPFKSVRRDAGRWRQMTNEVFSSGSSTDQNAVYEAWRRAGRRDY